jgi:ribonuclease BN (tRNA processing enzyme)
LSTNGKDRALRVTRDPIEQRERARMLRGRSDEGPGRRGSSTPANPAAGLSIRQAAMRPGVLLLVLAPLLMARVAAGNADSTRVVMLGTGTPNADPDRSGPSVAVVAGGRAYLVDCGPGVVRRAAAAATRHGIAALAADRLGIVFVTHLHSDHTLGLPDLMLTPWVLERHTPLEVYGPPGVAAMTRHLLEAYAEDIQVRQSGLEPDQHDGWKVNAHEIAPGIVYRDSNVTVKAFAVPHANWKHAFGYRFEARDLTVVFSGDTRPSDAVANACHRCDVLVHEVYSAARLASRPPEWQRYHRDAHTSTTELAEIATRARPTLLVLYHQLFWGASDDSLVAEVRRGYDGRVVSARDLDVYP